MRHSRTTVVQLAAIGAVALLFSAAGATGQGRLATERADSEIEALDVFRSLRAPIVDTDGRGVNWQDADENFEALNISSVLGQGGWFPLYAGAFIEDHSHVMARFGLRTLVLPRAGFSVPHGAMRQLSDVNWRRFDADIFLKGNMGAEPEGIAMSAVNGADGIINARVLFRRSLEGFSTKGDILALQLVPGEGAVFVDTGADWFAGIMMRLTIKVMAHNRVHVLLNNELIFVGHDLADEAGGLQTGTNRVSFIIQAGLSEALVDNVSWTTLVASDVNEDLVVDQDDLTVLLNAWGQADPIPDINGDGVVGGDDLAAMLSDWTH